MHPEPPSSSGKTWPLWRRGPFARYLTGEAISMTGTWMQVMAQNWVMTTLTDSAVMLGLVNFAGGVPMLALSLFGGTVADRCDKRRILLLTQVVQIVIATLGGWLVATGQIQIWHVFIGAAVMGVSNSFEMPSAAAFVPELVAKEQIATAIAMDRSVFHGTRLIGPALAGYAIGLWGEAAAFFLNALSFVALMVAIFSIPPRPPGTDAEEKQRRSGMKEGIAYVRSDPPTLAMIALMAATTVFVFPMMVVMLPLYARHELLLGADKMGLLMGISSIGSLTGSIGLMAVRKETRRSVMLAATVGVGLALVNLGAAQRFAVAAGTMVLLSLSVSTLIGLANTVVQERAPAALRGRVSAIAGLSFFGLLPFASLGLTSLADAMGMRPALFIAAGLYVVTATAVLARSGWRIGGEN